MNKNLNLSVQNNQKIFENFTEREITILWSVIQGWKNKYIAQYLCIAPSTVKFHLASLYYKTKTKNRTELAQKIFLKILNAPLDFETFSKLFMTK